MPILSHRLAAATAAIRTTLSKYLDKDKVSAAQDEAEQQQVGPLEPAQTYQPEPAAKEPSLAQVGRIDPGYAAGPEPFLGPDLPIQLVTAIADDYRRAIQALSATSIAAGQSPVSTALEIFGRWNPETGRREGGIVDLTKEQMTWIAPARAELSDPATAANFLDRPPRDKRFDSKVLKSAKTGTALSTEDVDKIVARYSGTLLKLLGEAIVRTEMLNSMRAGRHAAWQQAIDRGQMQARDVIVEWSATMDSQTRESHRHLNGHKVTFGNVFVSELGSRMAFPGDTSHGALDADIINCRCMALYRRRRVDDGAI